LLHSAKGFVYQRVLAAMALKVGVAGESHEGASRVS